MTDYVSLAEAASYLGVSKATLRNWDKAGKLRAVRNPMNRYRAYALSDLQALRPQLSLPELEPVLLPENRLSTREVRLLVSRLHNIFRDIESQSNLIHRFDELSKLIFLKSTLDQRGEIIATSENNSTTYANTLRNYYASLSSEIPNLIPPNFRTLNASEQVIWEAGNILSEIDFSEADFDVKGLAYEEVIRHTFDKSDHQQFFTPPNIVRFMVDTLSEYITGHVCDPAAGTGGFLVEVAKRSFTYESITAFEIDERLSWVSGMNTALHGGRNVSSHYLPDGGTLGSGGRLHIGKFDVILTNPPFGSDYADGAELNHYMLGKGRQSRRRGILFLERCHSLLRDKGYLGIIIDEGVLNLQSAHDVRAFLTDKFRVLGIISLPETAFMPYATVNASILLLQKQKRPYQKHVFFGHAERVGRKPNGDDDITYNYDGSSHPNSDLPELLGAWQSGPTGRAHDNERYYWANVSDNFDQYPNGLRLDYRYHHPSRALSRSHLAKCEYELVPLFDLCREKKSVVVPSKELSDSVILYTGLAHIEARTGLAQQVPTPSNSLKSAVKRYESGDILFARMRPNLRKVALIQFHEGGYTSPECAVLEPRRDKHGTPLIDPLLLSVLLRSDLVYGQIMHLIAGIGRPRINKSDLSQVVIPLPPREVQNDLRSRYLGSCEAAKSLREDAAKLLAQADHVEQDAVANLSLHVTGRYEK